MATTANRCPLLQTTYPYKPLTEVDGFRLLYLQPASHRNDELIGSLAHTTISASRDDLISHFTAISYVWGSPSPEAFIRLLLDYEDGDDDSKKKAKEMSVTIRITHNLSAALRDVRDTSRVFPCWADALCINQNDLEERSDQVLLMGDLYAAAGATVIHLGPSSPGLEFLCQAVRRQWKAHCLLRRANNGRKREERPESESSHNLDREMTIKVVYNELAKNPWFRRAWVFQELIISVNPYIQAGSTKIPWDAMCELLLPVIKGARPHLENQANIPAMLESSQTHYDNLKIIEDMLEARASPPETRTLAGFLARRYGSQATDPRDVVFSLMGIATDSLHIQREYFQVDYSRSWESLFAAVSRYMFEHHGWLWFFQRRSWSTPGLPSWATDWAAQQQTANITPRPLLQSASQVLETMTKLYPKLPSEKPPKVYMSQNCLMAPQQVRIREKVLACTLELPLPWSYPTNMARRARELFKPQPLDQYPKFEPDIDELASFWADFIKPGLPLDYCYSRNEVALQEMTNLIMRPWTGLHGSSSGLDKFAEQILGVIQYYFMGIMYSYPKEELRHWGERLRVGIASPSDQDHSPVLERAYLVLLPVKPTPQDMAVTVSIGIGGVSARNSISNSLFLVRPLSDYWSDSEDRLLGERIISDHYSWLDNEDEYIRELVNSERAERKTDETPGVLHCLMISQIRFPTQNPTLWFSRSYVYVFH